MKSNVRRMAALFDHVAAEPEQEAAFRWERIQRAAMDFRTAYRFSPDLVRVTFPPMSAIEADRARRAAYDWSFNCGLPDFKAAYRAEVAAINAAEVA